MEIEIKPAPRSNPEGLPHLPWNIWKNGVNTNVKPSRAEAEMAADNLRRKAGLAPSLDDEEQPILNKHYLDPIPQRGTPRIGALVEFDIYETTHVGEVVDHLSTQFIVEYPHDAEERKTTILRVDDVWKLK